MAYSLDDSLRREHRIGASLQQFQFNDTFVEEKFNQNIHWAAKHLWTRSLESQRDLIDIKRFSTNMKYFSRSVSRNYELGLPYFSYTLEIPYNNISFFDTREAKRRNVGKLNKKGCTSDCDDHHVNSSCASTHHVDRMKYPNLYTLQDTYNNREMFDKHLLVFVNGKIFSDIMFFTDVDKLILVIEPDVTIDDCTTIKLSEMKKWINDELPIDIIGIPWSPIYVFDGDPRNVIDSGAIVLENMTKVTNSMNINSTEWMLSFTTDDVNIGEMTTICTTLTYNSEIKKNLLNLSNTLFDIITRNAKIHCEAFPIPDLYGISTLGNGDIFQLPINGNAIPVENIILWEINSDGSYSLSNKTSMSIYYPNVYKIKPRFDITSSHNFNNYEFDEEKFQKSVNNIPGVYTFEAHRNITVSTNSSADIVVDIDKFGSICNYKSREYKFVFTPTFETNEIVGDFKIELNKNTFNRFVNNMDGVYIFTCKGIYWECNNNVVNLSDYGITLSNDSYKTGDKIKITYKSTWKFGENKYISSQMSGYGIDIMGMCKINDNIIIEYQDITWYRDDENVDIQMLGIDTLNSSITDGTSITIDYRFDNQNRFMVMWFQSFEDATEFDNPISDYMAYDISYANNVINGNLPNALKKYIPLQLKYDYKDHIRNMMYTTTQSEFNYKAKRFIEILKDNSNLYEYIYDQLMTRTAYENHTNTKIVWDFSDMNSWKKYAPHAYGTNDTIQAIFSNQISRRVYTDNHDEFSEKNWDSFNEPCYKFILSHDSPNNYVYSVWINGLLCEVKYIYREKFKTVIYLPASKISSTSVVEFEIMKILENYRFAAELDLGDLDNSVELPRIFPDVSPQNMMVCIRREVSTNKSSSDYNPKLYQYLSEEGIDAGENFGVRYFYEVAPAYELQWLLFGRRKYVDGVADGGTKITATTVPKLKFKDTLTDYKGSNLCTMFGEEYVTTTADPSKVDDDSDLRRIIVTADDEPTASGFYPTERRRFYQYIPYGKDADPIYITPIGKPTNTSAQEVVYGYTRDENNKIVKWHTQRTSLRKLFSRVKVVSIPNEISNFSLIGDEFADEVGYVNGIYVFEYTNTDGWHSNGLEHIDLRKYGMDWTGNVNNGSRIIVNYEAIPYLANQHILIQNADIYRNYSFNLEADIKNPSRPQSVVIDKFFDDPSPERFRIFCNGYLMEYNYGVDIDTKSYNGNFIRGDSITLSFKKGFRKYQLITSDSSSSMIISSPIIESVSDGLNAQLINSSDFLSKLLFNIEEFPDTGADVTFTLCKDSASTYHWKIVASSPNPEINWTFTDPSTIVTEWGIKITLTQSIESFSTTNPATVNVHVPSCTERADVKIFVEYLPYKLNRVFIEPNLKSEFVDCGRNNLTRPISLKYYDIYLDGVKLYEKDIRIISATKFIIKRKNIRSSVLSIYERAHDTELYGNVDSLPRSLIDSLCDDDKLFTEYLVKKYSH